MAPRFHMGITIWKRGLLRPHFHTGTVRFHTGIQNKWIPVTIWGSRYGKGDRHIPIWKWLITVSIWGLRICGSPFPYGNHHMETGTDASSFPYKNCPLPYGDSTQMDPRYHMGIPTDIDTSPYGVINHMGIEYFWLPISIWGSQYRNGD